MGNGGSAGIGWALAGPVAGKGANLVLTARRTERLQKLAAGLSAKHGVKSEVFAADLVRPEAPAEVYAFTADKGIEVGLLVNNAGFGCYGYNHEIPESRLRDMIQLNCSAVVHLTRLYVPGMVERRHGDVLIVASTAAFQAVPFISAYAATKAFDLIFAEGIAEEVRPFGVRVCALCPGSTNTEFQQVAQQPDRAFRAAETAEQVARVGLEGLARGKTLHRLQKAFIDHDSFQCGFCTSGMILSLKALLDQHTHATTKQVKEAIAGNYCRCGALPNILKAAKDVAQA